MFRLVSIVKVSHGLQFESMTNLGVVHGKWQQASVDP
jgi:hypothetical protein